MYGVVLGVYFGESLVQEPIKQTIFDTIPQNALFYFILVFIFLFIFIIIFYLIVPLFNLYPKIQYQKYLYLRGEMEKIDEAYSERKISFDDYVYAQFNYAKEYERITFNLVKIPEYKLKLQSYKLTHDTEEEIRQYAQEKRELTEKEKLRQKQVSLLYDLLCEQAKYFNSEEIKQAILDEGFPTDIAIEVVAKIKAVGVKFNSEVKLKENKVATFVNTLFTQTTKVKLKEVKEDSVISLKDTIKQPDKQKTGQTVSFSKTELIPEEKKTIWQAFKDLFGKKKTYTVQEVNDIFKDIEKNLKKNN